MFKNIYYGKTVLVTGHTGFKGTWLCMWLKKLGANVVGFSNGIISDPCHFKEINLESQISHVIGDVRDIGNLKACIDSHRPDIIIHLAAQALVRKSYQEPLETLTTNILGVANILQITREVDFVKAVVIITSDKCYKNVEWVFGYRETDNLGGDDPYSASKAAAEIVAETFIKSYFKAEDKFIATARAGNVIGGGDWAVDRIVPDSVRAWSANIEVVIRSPFSTRPWQHVLEPLSGYLHLGSQLFLRNSKVKGEPFNFGPGSRVNKTVGQLLDEMKKHWTSGSWNPAVQQSEMKEAGLLQLCCDKSHHLLNWYPTLNFEETVKFTIDWYREYYQNGLRNEDLFNLTLKQIENYEELAKSRNSIWIQ